MTQWLQQVLLFGSRFLHFVSLTHTHMCAHTLPFHAPILATVKMDRGCRLRSLGLGSHILLFAVQKAFYNAFLCFQLVGDKQQNHLVSLYLRALMN